MGRSEEYRAALRALPPERWDAWLTAHSGLPLRELAGLKARHRARPEPGFPAAGVPGGALAAPDVGAGLALLGLVE
jgi:hypothetical protein